MHWMCTTNIKYNPIRIPPKSTRNGLEINMATIIHQLQITYPIQSIHHITITTKEPTESLVENGEI